MENVAVTEKISVCSCIAYACIESNLYIIRPVVRKICPVRLSVLYVSLEIRVARNCHGHNGPR